MTTLITAAKETRARSAHQFFFSPSLIVCSFFPQRGAWSEAIAHGIIRFLTFYKMDENG